MFPLGKRLQALQAVHQAIIGARFEALSGEDTHKIAAILDDAEYAFSIVLNDEDDIDEFRRVLGRLTDRNPGLFGHLMEAFDGDMD